MRNCRDWLGCGAKRLDAQGRQDKRKVLTAASESSRLVQSRCRRVELLNGTGTEGVTLLRLILSCAPKNPGTGKPIGIWLMLRKRMTETSKIAPASTGLG